MLVNLKIISKFHAHPVHQHSVDIFGPRYVGDNFFRVETSLVQSSSRSLRDLKSLFTPLCAIVFLVLIFVVVVYDA